MNTHAIEGITEVVLFGLFLIVLLWQRNRKLTRTEVDNYVCILERDLPIDLEDRADYIARLRAWGEGDDGKRLFAVNVMRFFHLTLSLNERISVPVATSQNCTLTLPAVTK